MYFLYNSPGSASPGIYFLQVEGHSPVMVEVEGHSPVMVGAVWELVHYRML